MDDLSLSQRKVVSALRSGAAIHHIAHKKDRNLYGYYYGEEAIGRQRIPYATMASLLRLGVVRVSEERIERGEWVLRPVELCEVTGTERSGE